MIVQCSASSNTMGHNKSKMMSQHFGLGTNFVWWFSLGTYTFFFSMMGMTCRNQDRLVSYERNKNLDGTTAKASILFLTDCTLSESGE